MRAAGQHTQAFHANLSPWIHARPPQQPRPRPLMHACSLSLGQGMRRASQSRATCLRPQSRPPSTRSSLQPARCSARAAPLATPSTACSCAFSALRLLLCSAAPSRAPFMGNARRSLDAARRLVRLHAAGARPDGATALLPHLAAGAVSRKGLRPTAVLPDRPSSASPRPLSAPPARRSSSRFHIKVTASPHMVAGRAFSRRYRTPPSPWMRDYIPSF